MTKLKVVKIYECDSLVLEEIKQGFYILKAEQNFVCVRQNGNVLLDKLWEYKTNIEQKDILKQFLGGMYIEEIKKEVSRGRFKTANLNEIMSN